MSRNGKRTPPRPRIELRQSSASPQEAAAISAAIEQFMRDTAPAPEPEGPATGGWARAGLLENAGLDSGWRSAWGDAQPWGR